MNASLQTGAAWGAAVAIALGASLALVPSAEAGTFPARLSEKSKKCVDCHRDKTPSLYQQWGDSKHFRANIGCYECHLARDRDADAFKHEGEIISVIVSPRDCGRCHEAEVEQFTESHHAKAGRILGSLDNVLAEVVEGNSGFVTPAFPGGVSAAAANGCWQCHGAEVKVLKDGKLDPATWPNTGIGRFNPDGSEGSCTACHSRHSFSAAQARHPDTCGKCHMGPDHPQIEIYNESKHGIAFRANIDDMAMDKSKWVVGEDYDAAPTCATCHMSATPNQGVTHDVGLRISWNNRPAISVRPEVADAKLGLKGANIPWTQRRKSMEDVCSNCHNQQFVNGFYTQYDALIDLYHEKFAKPGLALMELVKPLKIGPQFSEKIDFTWFELWHHEGRRARHGASMMGPDITHWHGTYEVARNWYSEFIPELREVIERSKHSGDAAKIRGAEALEAKLNEILESKNHQWFLGKMDPEEKAKRDKRRDEFKARYK